jgi:molybdate transport system substrate-binding protein
MSWRQAGLTIWLFVFGALGCSGGASISTEAAVRAQAPSLTVSAAASLTDVLSELASRYEAATGERVQINSGASNTLARQIVEGAPVDLFISADEAQMKIAAGSGRIWRGSEVALLSNQLVIVVPKQPRVKISEPRDLADRTVARVAMGKPDAVPAGVYARQWLEQLGLWKRVQPKVVPLPTVRAVLAAVREARVDAGIVYATDAGTTSDVTIASRVERRDAPSIVYPAAVVAGPRQAEAKRFLTYLQSAEARAVFAGAGFLIPLAR